MWTHTSLELEWNRIQNVHKGFGYGKHFLPCQTESKLFFGDKDEDESVEDMNHFTQAE